MTMHRWDPWLPIHVWLLFLLHKLPPLLVSGPYDFLSDPLFGVTRVAHPPQSLREQCGTPRDSILFPTGILVLLNVSYMYAYPPLSTPISFLSFPTLPFLNLCWYR